MYGREPPFNELRFNKFFNKTNIIQKPKHKIYLDTTNYNVSMLNIQHITADITLNRSTVSKSFNPYGKEKSTFQSTAYYMSQTLALSYFHRSHLCYKSIINYDLDITNILVVSPQIRYIEVFNIMNPPLTNKFGRFPATSLNRGSTVCLTSTI